MAARPPHNQRALTALAAIVLLTVAAGPAAAGHRPVARWDVVPDQLIDAPFNVGVVAFHTGGVKVEFRVGGTLVATALNPTLNDRTGVWEFHFPLNPADYPDGAISVDARAVPLDGVSPSYDLPSLPLYANSGRSLGSDVVKWVDPSAGSDSNPGTETLPYATLPKAVQNTPPGGTVYLQPGTYYPDSLGGGSARSYWTTISAAPASPATRSRSAAAGPAPSASSGPT